MPDTHTQHGSDLRLLQQLARLQPSGGGLVPSEAAIAETLHAGRQQVREALAVLESYGAVRSRQGARRLWTGFAPDTFGRHLAATVGDAPRAAAELFEIRHAFETSHVGQASAHMTPAQRDALRRTVRRMTTAARRGSPIDAEDEEFHHLLFASVGNRVFEGVASAFWRLHERIRETSVRVEDLPSVAAMHARICEAVVERDVRLAAHELDAHFWGVRRRLLGPSRSRTEG
ncbi:FadR family transcriptional regulator [Cellulomonas hominis]|uniref:FadR family transcriptional regulator n=1 Tax=Cellulomonas hominis TaxID=156981 RepID=A0A7Z8JZK9_9CELL|nr:FCD domain-containing protein [Cellulomonas hominis]TKR24052.1 FadR family transcriptional regulator [Cellulomonas hominis]